jgi:hypothetical protein
MIYKKKPARVFITGAATPVSAPASRISHISKSTKHILIATGRLLRFAFCVQ